MPLLLWWLGLIGVAAAAGLVLVQYGPEHLRAVAFPLLFLLFALPPPVTTQNALQGQLQRTTTTAAAKMLTVLGIPVQQKGHILSLPSGDLGVVDACSGVRGVTAIIAIAALVAHLRGFGFCRGMVLTALALPIIAASNFLRVVLSGLLQEWLGAWIHQGVAHEALGVVTLLIGLAGVLMVSQLMQRKKKSGWIERTERPSPSDPKAPCPSRSAVQFSAAALLTVAVVGSTIGVWQARRVISGDEPTAPIADIPLHFGAWVGVDEPVDDAVRAALACDTAVRRVYRDPAGQKVHCWVIHWSAAAAVKDYIHHPDVCWPSQGWTSAGHDRKAVTLPSATPLEMTIRRFERDGQRQMIAYWAQDGNHIWTATEEERAHTSRPTHRWVFDRLLSRESMEHTPRLVVLVGTDLWGESGYAERAVEAFAQELAVELYRVCPWARPAEGE
jgi:EpsI family protein